MASGSFRVFIHANRADAEGKPMVVSPSDGMGKFMKSGGKKIGVKARRAFLDSGIEVEGVHELQAEDHIFLSAGEPFFKESGDRGSKDIHVAVLGTGGVGKSAITLRFVRNIFMAKWDPTIEDAYRKSVDVDDDVYTLDIVDTAGQDDFKALRPQWMVDQDGFLFVFALDDPESLNKLESFWSLHQQVNEGKQVPIILVGNKKDLVDADPSRLRVSEDMAQEVASRYGAVYLQTSALTGEGVSEAFERFVRETVRLRVGDDGGKARKKKRWLCNVL